MSISCTFRLATLSAAATAALLLIGAPPIASAAATTTALQNAGPHDGYTAGPDTAAAGLAVSPSGCVQFADHPHRSSTARGRVNGKVRAVCQVTVPKMSHSAQLWETRWWGWDRIGINQPYSRLSSKFGRAMANDWCKNNTVRVTGSGYVIDRDGRAYFASTISASVKNPCGF